MLRNRSLPSCSGHPNRDATPLRTFFVSREVRHVTVMMCFAAVILWNQIENEVFHSIDGIVYSLVAKELTTKPLGEWVVLTWYQSPFYEHPHLTPWMLGVCMAMFGVGTTTAIIPIVSLSTLTVLLTYFLGRKLIDHRYGLLAATTLALTPQFVKGGRNPMLEPALMFFIMLTIYCHIRATASTKYAYTVLMGLSLGLAFLAKGPPAILAVAVIVAFQGIALLFPDTFVHFKVRLGWSMVHLSCAIVVSLALVGLVDFWHYVIVGKSFFVQYLVGEWKSTVLADRGKANDLSYYTTIFFRYWPWLPFILVSTPLVIWRKDWVAVPVLILGSLVTGGTFLGFTLLTHKAFWYIAIHYVGSSLIAALTLRYVIPESWMEKHYAQCCLICTIAILVLSSIFPSLFLHYPRPKEVFFEGAASELGNQLEDKVLADCISMERWRGPFFFKFYLGATKTHCDDRNATFKVVDNRETYVFDQVHYRVLYSRHPFSIIERISD
jgi:4-amino-4-deoxy-L-arabinose transferase-like glycosyltransferase